MKRYPVFIEADDKAPGQAKPSIDKQPSAKEDLDGGDNCSVEELHSTDGTGRIRPLAEAE